MSSVISWLTSRRVEDRAFTRENVPATYPTPMLVTPTQAGVTLSERSALALADVLGCVRCIVEAGAALPLVGYRHADGGRERLAGGRLVSLLNRPAPGVTQAGFIGRVLTSLALRGNAFIALYSG